VEIEGSKAPGLRLGSLFHARYQFI